MGFTLVAHVFLEEDLGSVGAFVREGGGGGGGGGAVVAEGRRRRIVTCEYRYRSDWSDLWDPLF